MKVYGRVRILGDEDVSPNILQGLEGEIIGASFYVRLDDGRVFYFKADAIEMIEED